MADSFHDESDSADFAAATVPRPVAIAPDAPALPGRYGDRRAVNWPSIAAVVLIHALLIGAVLQARQTYVRHKEDRMVVVNLTPPPPPPAEEAPPPPARPELVVPPPVVRTPVPPQPQIVTMAEPQPAPLPLPPPTARVAPPAPPQPVRPAGPVQASDLGARMVSGKPPRYPIESRRKREQGTVVLSLVVGPDGRVSSIAVARSSGFPRLDDAARDAVRTWRWLPILRDGQPVVVQGVVDIPFVLQG